MITRSLRLPRPRVTISLNVRVTPTSARVRFVHASSKTPEEVKPAKRETIAPPKSFNNGVQSNRIKYLNALKNDLGDGELHPLHIQSS